MITITPEVLTIQITVVGVTVHVMTCFGCVRSSVAPGPPPDSPGGTMSMTTNPIGRPGLRHKLPPDLSDEWGVTQDYSFGSSVGVPEFLPTVRLMCTLHVHEH
jgi:hypothetical protein